MISFLTLQNLEFNWDTLPLLQIPKFELQSGEKLFLKGPSGSGKSTLINLLAGLLTPQKGEIHFNQIRLDQQPQSVRDRIRGDHMGFIFQSFNLIPYLTVLENVLLPLEFSSIKKLKVPHPKAEGLRILGSLGMESYAHQAARNLSVGQAQRVAVARAVIGAPELVFADEPTSALDADSREMFLALLLKECASSAVIFVSHDLSLGKHFDRVVDLSALNLVKSPRGGAL